METTSLPPDDRPPEARPRRANRGLLWAAALAVVVLAVATLVAFLGGSDDGADPGTQVLDPNASAPAGVDGLDASVDVTGQRLPDVGYETFDGAPVELATDGKPLLINFWSSICTPCIKEMPDLEQAYQANRGQVDFLGLQVSELPTPGLKMIEQTGVTYPTGRDWPAKVFRAFGGSVLPRTVIVNADGTIAYVHSGALTAAELQQAIDQSLAG